MKHKIVIEIITENYAEQQFILSRFPEAFWRVPVGERTIFHLPYEKDVNEKVRRTLQEWEMKNG
jgi:hypothetical protein